MKYGHIKTRLDDNKTGFVKVSYYSSYMPEITGFGTFNEITTNYPVTHDIFMNVHINKKGNIVKNEA